MSAQCRERSSPLTSINELRRPLKKQRRQAAAAAEASSSLFSSHKQKAYARPSAHVGKNLTYHDPSDCSCSAQIPPFFPRGEAGRWKNISFFDFRQATVRNHPSLSFLGPATMAVYWWKEQLKKQDFGWVRCNAPASLLSQNAATKGKEYLFCHIPGQYLSSTVSTDEDRTITGDKNSANEQHLEKSNPGDVTISSDPLVSSLCSEKQDSIADKLQHGAGGCHDEQEQQRRIDMVLKHGVAGVHYATSFMGVYNLIRTYGAFARHCGTGQVVVTKYHGPALRLPSVPASASSKEESR